MRMWEIEAYRQSLTRTQTWHDLQAHTTQLNSHSFESLRRPANLQTYSRFWAKDCDGCCIGGSARQDCWMSLNWYDLPGLLSVDGTILRVSF
ncbi:hypothetical protein RSAG8_13005, partial [Rhizoctonia solani AG-8 WAC10335]